MTPKERLIFALDVSTRREALALCDELAGEVGMFKVGLELFVSEGPDLVREVARRAPVFLDLKLHDIPATVGRAAAVADRLGVHYLTVHVDEGGRSLAAAVEACSATRILGITVLTSISDADLQAAGLSTNVEQTVLQRAQLAAERGVAGIVCSGQEASRVREAIPKSMEVITPGVRPAGTNADDQARVVTPAMARLAGADRIVVGRPIRDAKDRVSAARALVAELG
ncbi:MAG: orotidine-5'-phosphate decarboxylase [Deltaproteobacteria bacterium]|nr:orotidine-5'-phosphate decarboxylase [Deltaproteobacteria bacterium]